MGMGDVKLAGVMGLFLGRAVAPAIFIALLAGVLAGAVVIARKGADEGRKTAVPFGPFLALGALVGVFAGQDLVGLYLNHFL
jgi:leader peptidase (prepilin peptidase)/N-methyltransferase